MMLFQDIPDGVKLRGRDFTKITQAHNADRVISVQGATTFPGSNGTALVIPRPKTARRVLASHPFKIINASNDTPAARVTVVYGTVNNFVPTILVGGTQISLFTDPSPILTVVTGTVYLDATLNNGVITGVVIANAATTPADTATHKYKTIGSVAVTSNAITAIGQSVKTSLTLYLCVGTAIWEVI